MNESKIALVTGGTDGIGREVARSLSRRGFQPVIVGRNPEKGTRVVDELNDGLDHDAAVFFPADLSLMHEVRSLSNRFHQQFDRLDLLIHSAGVINMGLDQTQEGHEVNFATDYLSRFALTNLLMGRLQSSAPGRIVNIAAARGKGKLDFEHMRQAKYGGMRALGQAQLANEVFTLELASRLEGTGVEAAVIHPGAVDTNIRRQFPNWLNSLMGFVMRRFVMTPAEGAELPLWLSTDAEHINGKLYKPAREEITPDESVLDSGQRERLWQLSAELTGVQAMSPLGS